MEKQQNGVTGSGNAPSKYNVQVALGPERKEGETLAGYMSGNMPRFTVKRMLEPEGTRFGVYRDGKIWETGYITEKAAQEMADLMNRHSR